MSTEIFKCVAGSRLFGTATPTSDTDYKAVHIPAARSILLGTADAVIDQSTGTNTTSNTAEDVDCVSFPLQRYLGNLAKMEVNALEMLFAPNMVDGYLWPMLRDNRFRVMTASKKPFVGFARNQAMRYAVRGDRLDSLVELVKRLKALDPDTRMTFQKPLEVFDGITGVTVYRKHEGTAVQSVQTPYLNVFGREVPLTCFPKEAIKVYQKPIDEAGQRTKASAAEGGPDWKGLYHAQRVIDEGIELFSTGELLFPCQNSNYYMSVRTGQVDLEDVLDHFEQSLLALEAMTPISEFREKADTEWIDEFVASFYEQAVVDAYHAWKDDV